MSRDPSIDAGDERLRRLGAQWFAEIRGRNPEPAPPRRPDVEGVEGDFLDGLFGGDAGDPDNPDAEGGD